MTLPTGARATILTDTARKAVVEAVHRDHVPGAWRDLVTWERAQVTHEDVLQRLGVATDAALVAVLGEGETLTDHEFNRLVQTVKDEIALERAEVKLPHKVWSIANQGAH